jgi:hypothetical protein
MPLHLNIIPGFSDVSDSVFVAGQVAFGLHLEQINANAACGMDNLEIFQAIYVNGDTVALPVSPTDGYIYDRSELIYIWTVRNSVDPKSNFITGPDSLWFANWDVNQSTGEVFSEEWYERSSAADSRNPAQSNDGSIQVFTIGQRQRANIFMAVPASFTAISEADIATDKPLTQALAQALNDDAKFCCVNTEVFYLGEYVTTQIVTLPTSPVDGYAYSAAECKFMFSWRWTTLGTAYVQPPGSDEQAGPFDASVSSSGVCTVSATFSTDGGNSVISEPLFGRIAVFAFCTRSATPTSFSPTANSFTEIDPDLFFPGNDLRASEVLDIKHNIDEALLSPEFFGPTDYADGSTVPTPTSPVDGYVYSRAECVYVWTWKDVINNSGGTHVRLPLFYGTVDQTTGAVSLNCWRLPPGGPYVDDSNANARVSVIVVASRQASHPPLVDTTTTNAPTGSMTTFTADVSIIEVNGFQTAQITNFNDTTPAAPGGKTNILWQKGTSTSPCPVSAYVDLTLPLFVGGETPAGVIDGSNLEFDLQYAPAVYTPIAGETTDNGWLILQMDDKLLAPEGTGITGGAGVGFQLRGAHITLTAGYAPTKSIVAWYIRKPIGTAAPAGVSALFTENAPTAVVT